MCHGIAADRDRFCEGRACAHTLLPAEALNVVCPRPKLTPKGKSMTMLQLERSVKGVNSGGIANILCDGINPVPLSERAAADLEGWVGRCKRWGRLKSKLPKEDEDVVQCVLRRKLQVGGKLAHSTPWTSCARVLRQ